MALTVTPLDERIKTKLAQETALGNTAIEDVFGAPCTVRSILVDNQASQANFLKLYNARDADDSDTPIIVIEVQNGSTRLVDLGDGLAFSVGFSARCVTAGGTAGTTSPSGGNVGVDIIATVS